MKNDQSCLIIGGGCAGLSLALALAKKQAFSEILILESEKAFQAKQTWCYWNVASHPFEHCVSHRWSEWLIRKGNQTSLTRSSNYAYHHLPSAAFFSWAQQELKRYPSVSLHMNTTVNQLEEKKEHVKVNTSHGSFETSLVFDSRVPDYQTLAPALLQHFHGWTVYTEKSLFNPPCITLMDFYPCDEGVHFFYVLPFSPHEALVESTYFSSKPFELSRYETDLRFYLEKHYHLTNYQILRKETGTLPMQVDYGMGVSPGKRIIPIGTRAGWLKPSTGYGFLAIQRAVQHITQSVSQRNFSKSSNFQPFPFRWLDQTFLTFIQKDLSHAPAIFHQLFADAPSDALIRFLGESASLTDIVRVMQYLPKKALVKHLLGF
jgi:lycopene beta-cyclase